MDGKDMMGNRSWLYLFRYLGAYRSPTWAYAKLPSYYQFIISVLY